MPYDFEYPAITLQEVPGKLDAPGLTVCLNLPDTHDNPWGAALDFEPVEGDGVTVTRELYDVIQYGRYEGLMEIVRVELTNGRCLVAYVPQGHGYYRVVVKADREEALVLLKLMLPGYAR
jgi:hypothetical protein